VSSAVDTGALKHSTAALKVEMRCVEARRPTSTERRRVAVLCQVIVWAQLRRAANTCGSVVVKKNPPKRVLSVLFQSGLIATAESDTDKGEAKEREASGFGNARRWYLSHGDRVDVVV
jgi:hypothetical protein